jgi:hypothetical protein
MTARTRKPKAPRVSKTPVPRGPESQVQIAVRAALTWHGIRSAHVPNGGSRNPIEARKLKAQGVLAGFPDLVVWAPGKGMACMEVKAASGRVSDAQEAMIAQLEADGVPVAIVRSVDDALAAVKCWGWI